MERSHGRDIMKDSTTFGISSFILIAMAILFVWDSSIWAWFAVIVALYSGACYGWHREALKEEKEKT